MSARNRDLPCSAKQIVLDVVVVPVPWLERHKDDCESVPDEEGGIWGPRNLSDDEDDPHVLADMRVEVSSKWGWRVDLRTTEGPTSIYCSRFEDRWNNAVDAFDVGRGWFDDHPCFTAGRVLNLGISFQEEWDGIRFLIYGVGEFGLPLFRWNVDYTNMEGQEGLIECSEWGVRWPSRAEAARAGHRFFLCHRDELAREAHRRNALHGEGSPATVMDGLGEQHH